MFDLWNPTTIGPNADFRSLGTFWYHIESQVPVFGLLGPPTTTIRGLRSLVLRTTRLQVSVLFLSYRVAVVYLCVNEKKIKTRQSQELTNLPWVSVTLTYKGEIRCV